MKTLQNHTLIYDSECPMCNIYSKGFIKSRMPDKNSRKTFTELSFKNEDLIDLNRSKMRLF